MKRWRLYTAALVIALLAAWSVRHAFSERAQRQRQFEYEKVLRSYSEVLKTGMTRKEVEDYLSAKNIRFRQMCCVNSKEFSRGVYDHAYDDLVKIGKEDAPWFCSEHNVYIALQFLGSQPQLSGAASSDTLKNLTVYHWLEGCM